MSRWVPLREWLDSNASARLPEVVRASFERTLKTRPNMRIDLEPEPVPSLDDICPCPPGCRCQEGPR